MNKRKFNSEVKKLGYIIKDFSEDDDYKLKVNLFICDKDDNTLVQIKTEANIFKDINSINIATNFNKEQKSYKNKYELLKVVIEYMEAYEKLIDEDFKEAIEDYQSSED